MAVVRVTVHIAVVLIFIVAPSLRSVFICSIIRGAAKVKRGEGRKKPGNICKLNKKLTETTPPFHPLICSAQALQVNSDPVLQLYYVFICAWACPMGPSGCRKALSAGQSEARGTGRPLCTLSAGCSQASCNLPVIRPQPHVETQ